MPSRCGQVKVLMDDREITASRANTPIVPAHVDRTPEAPIKEAKETLYAMKLTASRFQQHLSRSRYCFKLGRCPLRQTGVKWLATPFIASIAIS